MANFPNLKELLSYGDEYKLNEPIMSDYFIVDPNRCENNQQQQNTQDSEAQEQEKIPSDDQSSEQDYSHQGDANGKMQQGEGVSDKQEVSIDDINDESLSHDSFDEAKRSNEEQMTDDNLEQGKLSGETDDASLEEEIRELDVPSEDSNSISSDESKAEDDKEEIKNGEEIPDADIADDSKLSDEEKPSDEEISSDDEEPKDDENAFDDLMNNYEEDKHSQARESNKSKGENHASSKLNDITISKIYRILKKLVSLSYDTYQKGTYRYDKKEVVKHYITKQKFKIIDDLVGPSFKPDIYVFDLSPSNDEFLEMYVNAIGSVAMKNSLIYLTFNERILRKLEIKKSDSRGIDVNKVVNSDIARYANFDCTIYQEYTTIYEELRAVKNRKIYVFSDFDVRDDMINLSKENPDIVWFSTQGEGDDSFLEYYFSKSPSQYKGYYVEISNINDIEKYILEKNKSRYRRNHNG